MRPATFPMLLQTCSMLLLGACASVGPKPPPPPDARVFDTTDKLMDELAERARRRSCQSDDFQVIVTGSAYPIGTLIRPGTSIPVDYRACTASAPPKYGAPNLFPNYNLSSKVALDFGLDSEVIGKVASAGVNIGATDTVGLTFKALQSSALSDADLKRLTSSQACRAALAGQTIWLVRGYIEGQRTFLLERAAANTVNLGISKVGTFKVDFGTGEASVGFTDDQAVQFLQVIS